MSHDAQGDARGLTILVVDDDALVRWTLTAALSPRFALHVAGTFRDALAYIGGDGALDAAILDVRLPDGSGLALVTALAHARPNAPVVVLSASSEMRGPALVAGAVDFIEKPFEVADVMARVGAALLGRITRP